jgi:hypothetical protein
MSRLGAWTTTHYTVGGILVTAGSFAAFANGWWALMAAAGMGLAWRGVRLARAETRQLVMPPNHDAIGPGASTASLIEEKWLPEAERFSRLATVFWDAVRDQFERYGTLGHPTMRSGLDDRVTAAGWPDELGDADEDWPDGETVPLHTSAFFLGDFVKRLYANDMASFEPHREELAILSKRWWSRAENAADSPIESWLGPAVGAVNMTTVKLLWYVEIAKAEAIHNPAPDYRPCMFLRRILTPSGTDTSASLSTSDD